MNRISYNNDLRDNIIGTGLVDTIPDCEQFSFSACYKRSMVDCLGERMICYVDVRD